MLTALELVLKIYLKLNVNTIWDQFVEEDSRGSIIIINLTVVLA